MLVFSLVLFAACGGCGSADGQGSEPLSGLTVVTKPDKTEYTAGETFDPTGMVIAGTFGKSSQIITGFECAPTRALVATDEHVTVTYGGFYTTVPIAVKPAASGNPGDPENPLNPDPNNPGNNPSLGGIEGAFKFEAISFPMSMSGFEMTLTLNAGQLKGLADGTYELPGSAQIPGAFLEAMAAFSGVFDALSGLGIAFEDGGTVTLAVGEAFSQSSLYRLEGQDIVLVDEGGAPLLEGAFPGAFVYKDGKVNLRIEFPDLSDVEFPGPGEGGFDDMFAGFAALGIGEITLLFGSAE